MVMTPLVVNPKLWGQNALPPERSIEQEGGFWRMTLYLDAGVDFPIRQR